MKKTKLLFTLFFVLCIIFSLAGCDDHVHAFGEWTVEKAATCAESGTEVRTCSCGEREERIIEKLACDFGEWTIEQESTCAEAGIESRKCKREGCGNVEKKALEKTPHAFGEWTLEREPDCFNGGLEVRVCSECSARDERLTDKKNDHVVGDWKIINDASCTEEGLKERFCECGEREEQTIAPLGHSFGEWTLSEAATCVKKGTEVRLCFCGEREERRTEFADHKFENWVYAEPTCTTDGLKIGTCVCGEKEEVIIPTSGHKYGLWLPMSHPTCLARGRQIRYCACGDSETRFVDKLPHTPTVIPAVAPTVSSTGLTEGSKCSACGTVLVPQETVERLPLPINTQLLSHFGYEGYSDKLIFYWAPLDDFAELVEKIQITVNDGSTSEVFIIDASTEGWTFTPKNSKTTYTFSAAGIDNRNRIGAAMSRACYWNPEAKALSFPRVEITTQMGELPTYSPSGGPAGTWGGGIKDANYVQSLVSVYGANDELLYRSASSDFSQAKIKVRGNTSARSPKEPFKIKLNKKADLLAGLVERDETVDYRDKNWLLLKTGYDMDLAMGYTMSRLVGRDYSPAYSYVSLFVNGDFRGLYVLIEPVDDGEARCDISSTGYIIEMDAYYWNEPLYFTTPVAIATPGVRPVGYTFKAPDADNLTINSPEVTYIQQYMTELENALLYGGDLEKYLDIRSCAEWLLVHDLVSTWDSGGSNMYLTKYDNTDGSVVFMGPNWDFDSAFWSHSYATDQFARIRYNDHFYMYKLVNNSEFKRIYKELYDEVRSSVLREIRKELSKYETKEYEELLRLENERWGSSHNSFARQKNQVLSWFSAHLEWMDQSVSW